jgi:hypothetical protein
MTATLGEQWRGALAVAAGLAAATVTVAVIVRVGFAGEVRQALGFPFAGIPARPETAATILANNARLLAAVFAAVLIAQSPWLAGPNGRRGLLGSALLACVDTVLVLAVATNALVVGAALGAYGSQMFAAVLPHGPLELAAFAAALALHLQAHRRRLAAHAVLGTAATCLALLALAAALETYVRV